MLVGGTYTMYESGFTGPFCVWIRIAAPRVIVVVEASIAMRISTVENSMAVVNG
jgi:hypothetical protein